MDFLVREREEYMILFTIFKDHCGYYMGNLSKFNKPLEQLIAD